MPQVAGMPSRGLYGKGHAPAGLSPGFTGRLPLRTYPTMVMGFWVPLQDHWSREDHEEAHFFAFVAHNVREHGQDRSRWNRPGPKTNTEPRRIGNPPLSFREYRSQHDGCWVCYGKGNNHAHDHRQCKVYEADKKAYFAAHPEKKPKEQRIADWNAKGGDGGRGQGKGQGKGGGRDYGGGPGQDRRVRSIEEVAEDMLRTLEELKAQQRGGQSPGRSQPEGAVGSQV